MVDVFTVRCNPSKFEGVCLSGVYHHLKLASKLSGHALTVENEGEVGEG